MAGKIVVLEQDVADKIAAGEVVERPASVVKELVENALDAGATRILVDIRDGGTSLVRVADNGAGMSREDAVLALQRHATSKIRSADDLFAVSTLGFRGEALPSIAAVSQLEMVTRPADLASGVTLKVDGGNILDLEDSGAPVGTRISVANLFFNTPARLKFLKSNQTEMNHIADLIGRLALAFHTVGFRLTHNGQEVFSTPGSPELIHAVAQVLGPEVSKQMVPVALEDPEVQVAGYVSRPSHTRASRAGQLFFVNRRTVRSPLISKALDECFRTLLPQGRYPLAALFVQVPPEDVDVNVHPTKAEVRFRQERAVYGAAVRAVQRALWADPSESSGEGERHIARLTGTPDRGQPAAPAPPRKEEKADIGKLFEDEEQAPPQAVRESSSVMEPTRALFRPEPAVEDFPDPFADIPAASPPPPQAAPPRIEVPPERALPLMRSLVQMHNTYMIGETREGIFIIDQHVAHERVLFDRLMAGMEAVRAETQPLLIPLTLKLSHRESPVLEANEKTLEEMGFEIEPFGRDTYVVRAIPLSLVGKDYEQALRAIVDELCEQADSSHLAVRREEVASMVACKAAVKAGDALTHEEMAHLLDELRETRNPYTCPHGRPIVIVLSVAELEKRFKRR
ncbi:MAG: DNA mismatch repair endonuclease MutL [Armatimonadetes bacterium]|nr:DNA mismatch repair endonuclease MutL [Armatimonadota bacterium]